MKGKKIKSNREKNGKTRMRRLHINEIGKDKKQMDSQVLL
jgi:hypothetical protein